MSSTFKIATVLATDPRREIWEQIDAPLTTHLAAKLLSKFRAVVLEFPVLTSAQYAQWLAVCELNTANAPYLPDRINATYTTSPEIFSGTDPGLSQAYTVQYRYHFLGSRHSSGVYVYDTRIRLYMTRLYSVEGGG